MGQYFTTLSSIRISSGDTDLINNLNIYPNPNRGVFNISFISDEVNSFQLTIVDAFGKIIELENKELFVGEFTKQVNLSEYPKGIYILFRLKQMIHL